MKKTKIDKKLLDKMVKLRELGATYEEICRQCSVSKWSCINYLRDVPVVESAVVQEWKEAEKEARAVLEKKYFTEIHNLNDICPSPYWDYLAKLGKEWWLIDVTISSSKTISGKIPRMLDSYKHAILFKDGLEWSLISVTCSKL